MCYILILQVVGIKIVQIFSHRKFHVKNDICARVSEYLHSILNLQQNTAIFKFVYIRNV